MKKIKIKFVGLETHKNIQYINGVLLEDTWLYKTLDRNFDVEISDNPDYVICSCFNLYEYCQYPQIRIMYSAENYVPDFNLIDYAISNYPLEFLDRNFYLPQSLWGYDGERSVIQNRTQKYDKSFLKTKTRFANFIASYDSENNYRGEFFKKLNERKKVDSAGRWLNNTGINVRFQDDSKINFQKECKFSLCFESVYNGGFNTEKIMDAFYADTIPIYYGDPYITSIFNPRAFINVADFESFDDAIDFILEIDADDDKYLEMLNQPIFNDDNYITKKFDEAEKFLIHIFEQPIEKCGRRSRVVWAKQHDSFITVATPLYKNFYQNKLLVFYRRKKRQLKKVIKKVLERL